MAALALLASACGGEDATGSFCRDADAFVAHQEGLADVVFSPTDTEAFFAESVQRISDLADDAPPTVADDVAVVRDGFLRLQADLASVGHDVTALSDAQLDSSATASASDRLDDFLAGACRDDGDPLPTADRDPLAPLALTPAEMAELRSSVDDAAVDDELAERLATQLADELGLDPAAASCLVDSLGVSFLSSFTDGTVVTETDRDRFRSAAGDCGLDLGVGS